MTVAPTLEQQQANVETAGAACALPGLWLWIWEAPDAPAHALDFYAGAIVRAANGNGTVAGDSKFDFAASYKRWVDRFGAERCAAWTWIYGAKESGGAGTDGAKAAKALAGSAPHAPAYIADVEADVKPQAITTFCATLRALRPGVPIGFSSYPTRAQAVKFGVPWDTLVAECDFGAPQVYFPEQAAQLAQVVTDHKGKYIHVAVWPDAKKPPWQGWIELARSAMRTRRGVSVWAHPVRAEWNDAIRSLAAEQPAIELSLKLVQLDLRKAQAQPVRHPSVRHVQGLLAAAGSLDAAKETIDGVGDAGTKKGLMAFQKSRGLKPDAIVGPMTWKALLP